MSVRAAARDSASTAAPSTLSPRMENIACRTKSVVGLATAFGTWMANRPAFPAMIRTPASCQAPRTAAIPDTRGDASPETRVRIQET